MSEQDQREKISAWLSSTDAKREFFLNSDDLDMLNYQHRQMEPPVRGRPVKLWNPKDLEKAAIEKYGKKEFLAKLDRRARRKPNHCAIFNNGKESIEIKHTEGKKRKRALSKDSDDGNDNGDDESYGGLEELCVVIKKCNKEQLEQIVTLMAQTDSSFLELFKKVKLVSLLPRSKFQTAYPELAKLLSTEKDDNDSGHTECIDDDDDKEGGDDDKRASNMDLEGSWTLSIVTPTRRKGEEGSLDIIFFSSGSSVDGSICFPSSCCLGDIVGFKTNGTMEDTNICFETRSESKREWYTGVLQTFVSRDEEGVQVSGSFWPGFKKQDLPNTIHFTGRKAGATTAKIQ